MSKKVNNLSGEAWASLASKKPGDVVNSQGDILVTATPYGTDLVVVNHGTVLVSRAQAYDASSYGWRKCPSEFSADKVIIARKAGRRYHAVRN